jgi:membrane protein DedA with SNARE-associated domain
MTAHVTHWIAAHGLPAMFILMAIDAVLPAGGEVVMLFAGALAAIAGPSLATAIVTGTLGYLTGSLAGWAIGRAGGRTLIERHGRRLHVGPERFARAEGWFERYGSAFVLAGRLVPLVRSFVSIPAGVLEFPLPRYAALTALASLAWCAGFGIAGHALGSHWESLDHAFRYLDVVAVAGVVAGAGLVVTRARVAR